MAAYGSCSYSEILSPCSSLPADQLVISAYSHNNGQTSSGGGVALLRIAGQEGVQTIASTEISVFHTNDLMVKPACSNAADNECHSVGL